MNVGDWVEIDTGNLKGSLARITFISEPFYSVRTTDGFTGTYMGSDCFKQKPTTPPSNEYLELFK